MTRPSPSALVRLYGGVASLVAPLALRGAVAKLKVHGVDPKRFSERKGIATLPRPEGGLIWFHAASVGESLSVLRLIEHLGVVHPELHFLITSGTATSAEILSRRLPARTRHQFAPLDSALYMRRFLDHWQPDAAVFVESEFWPNMLRETASRAIPLALLNARVSKRSAEKWKKAARTSRYLLGLFTMIHCQDAATAAYMAELGRPDARQGQNLKSISGPLPYDKAELRRMQQVLQGRPLWLASSTHPGEDEIMLSAHQALLPEFPGLLLILVPRHPERAPDIEVMIADHRLRGQRRSLGAQINGDTQVYLADTLGETGLWYALSPITCICGSFTPVGGHNPYEPAHAGSALLHGPLYANFAQVYEDLDAAGAAREVHDAAALENALRDDLNHPSALQQRRNNARAFVQDQAEALKTLGQELSNALSLGL
ncbi:3-deoxy-D-manno-octulosonic acid transferase [Roseovarius faecimaris]|uniref:3-deoxy-D-manno-octulosonic acid transferase n=1 Tax=Roseovarius faecimaris TaxID=2494550 RepID=A0A6I6IQ65_9RHOB|nr:3-deoxy-D-manno-octulosonic acid transferase [Roseovarius faecimaris]QGX97971.1 3-deoxy-D-manno-octulosonic acid transferase [Roseovarius faecimaris]